MVTTNVKRIFEQISVETNLRLPVIDQNDPNNEKDKDKSTDTKLKLKLNTNTNKSTNKSRSAKFVCNTSKRNYNDNRIKKRIKLETIRENKLIRRASLAIETQFSSHECLSPLLDKIFPFRPKKYSEYQQEKHNQEKGQDKTKTETQNINNNYNLNDNKREGDLSDEDESFEFASLAQSLDRLVESNIQRKKRTRLCRRGGICVAAHR
mmetsp:Transcript_4684/g.10028  ORF Transcript_4684/g.10028 Transcript_4684/m.10028 type:complete len:208 (+) Transcript_4684:121-744(+)